jgi:ADP-ribose pyrophosphatase YjhB (NUDIX family)
VKYCCQCGARGSYRIPQGDDRPRFVCSACQAVHYDNPKLVVGCIPVWKERLLLCRRAIEPRYGKWTIPAGFLEIGETVQDGAKRETLEEAGAKVEHLKPYALYNLSFIGQIYLIFLSRLQDGNFSAGHESIDVGLFDEHEIPWDDMAFPVIGKILRRYFEDVASGHFTFHIGDITPGIEL